MWLWAAGIERFKRILYGITTETYKYQEFCWFCSKFCPLTKDLPSPCFLEDVGACPQPRNDCSLLVLGLACVKGERHDLGMTFWKHCGKMCFQDPGMT
jgi:hypothetical protein